MYLLLGDGSFGTYRCYKLLEEVLCLDWIFFDMFEAYDEEDVELIFDELASIIGNYQSLPLLFYHPEWVTVTDISEETIRDMEFLPNPFHSLVMRHINELM